MRISHLFVLPILTMLVLAWVTDSSLADTAAQKPVRVLIVTGHDVKVHPWRETTPFTRKILEETGKFDVKVCEDTSIFESSTLAEHYDVLMLNFGFWSVPQLTDRAKEGLLSFVRNGGGLVAIHFASSSYQGWKEYAELLGRVWVKGVAGHGPRSVFTVKIIDHDSPITQGVSDFKADDELYAKLSGDAKIHVLGVAESDWSGKTEPLLFTRTYGEGRVFHDLLGHDVKARDYPAYKKLLIQGTLWAAKELPTK